MAQDATGKLRDDDARGGGGFVGRRVHMIGIGGAGMSGAARMLADMGAKVSGSDVQAFDGLGGLAELGVRVTIGHNPDLLSPDLDLVVCTAAIPAENPELLAAARLGLPITMYAELIGAIMRQRVGVAIAGTHGKSTTTAMCAHLFRQAGLEPSFLFGARSEQLGGSAGVGHGPHFIVESCEFNRSFLHLEPHAAAVLNIEPDHLDCYVDLEAIVDAFRLFCSRVAPDGLVVVNSEDKWALKAAEASRAPVQTVGFEEHADWRAYNLFSDQGRYSFTVAFRGVEQFASRLSVPGRYNVSNALAAVALAHEAGVTPKTIARALPGFAGISRRMSLRGTGKGVVILDDYAHHPTEVRVTIGAARSRYRPKRTWVIFQPHQLSRTRHFLEEFALALGEADEVIIPDIYNAREVDAEGYGSIGSQTLVSRIQGRGGKATYVPTLAAVADHLMANVAEGDLVVTMGAGDIWKVADELVARIGVAG